MKPASNKFVWSLAFFGLLVAGFYFFMLGNSEKNSATSGVQEELESFVAPRRIELFSDNRGGYGTGVNVICPYEREVGKGMTDKGVTIGGPKYAYYETTLKTATSTLLVKSTIKGDVIYTNSVLDKQEFVHTANLAGNKFESSWFYDDGKLTDLPSNHPAQVLKNYFDYDAPNETRKACYEANATEIIENTETVDVLMDEVLTSSSTKTEYLQELICVFCQDIENKLINAQCQVLHGCEL